MATASGVSTESRCGYCWEFYVDMTDPRELPCGHVNCRTCMEHHYDRSSGIECPHCQ